MNRSLKKILELPRLISKKPLPRKTPFVVLTTNRSGSSHLCSLISQHPEIICYSELLKKQKKPPCQGVRYQDGASSAEFAKFVFEHPSHSSQIKAVGFKLFDFHCLPNDEANSQPNVWSYLNSLEQLKIVRLVRKNPLRRYLSLRVAKRTKQWRIKKLNDKKLSEPFEIDKNHFIEWYKKSLIYSENADERTKNCDKLVITYSDLFINRNTTMAHVFEFLKLPSDPTVSSLSDKFLIQRKRTLLEQISNYQKLRKDLQGTKFEKFFDDSNGE